MKSPVSMQLVALLVASVAIFACFSSFYSLNRYYSPASCSSDPRPVSLSMPVGNCSCTVSQATSPGGVSIELPTCPCDCHQPTGNVNVQLQGVKGVTNSTKSKLADGQVCPPPEVQVVEKEVVKEVDKRCPGVPWYAPNKEWHFPAAFPLCSMDVCFNYSRCENMEEPLVFTYDLPSPPIRNFYNIKKSKYWTSDPEKACLFFVFLDTRSPWPVRPKDLQHWNGGLNHVLITFADKWEKKGPAPNSIGNASIMATIVYETTSRPGFDISITLPGKADCSDLQSVNILQRKYFATFRGTRYLGERGDGVFRSLDSFRGMHNGEDVIVAASCRHQTNNLVRKERPYLGVNCDEDQILYESYGFYDLMNTTFGIVPAGRQPNSFRFMEVLSAGSIPVLIADNYVKPFDTMIHWHDCLLQFPTSQMHRIIPTLRAVREEEIVQRHENCLQIFNEFLKDDETLQESAMRALKERFLGVIPNFAHVRRKSHYL